MVDRKAYMKDWWLKNKHKRCKVAQRKAWRKFQKSAKGKLAQRTRLLKQLYNLSVAEYDFMLDMQGGCCAICGKDQSGFKLKLAVDHNHTTGEVRGILCPSCNIKLGWYEKRIETIHNYLGD